MTTTYLDASLFHRSNRISKAVRKTYHSIWTFLILIQPTLALASPVDRGDPERHIQGASGPPVSKMALPTVQTSVHAVSRLRTPGYFEENKGQADPSVRFLTRKKAYSLFLTDTDTAIVAETSKSGKEVIRMRLAGSKSPFKIAALDPLPGRSNYFIGNDPAKWRTNVPHFARVKVEDIYPGIELVYYNTGQNLEYDFIVSPGAKPETIKLSLAGTNRPKLLPDGSISVGSLSFLPPVLYQETGGVRQSVYGGYTLNPENGLVSFNVGTYDTSLPLVIDPVLTYSSYIGGSGRDEAYDIALDPQGNIYMAGFTQSQNFPSCIPFENCLTGLQDSLITKMSADGSTLLYATYLGGGGTWEATYGIAVDQAGQAWVVGTTWSTPGEESPNPGGNTGFPLWNPLPYDACTAPGLPCGFVSKLDANGSTLVFSTLVSGLYPNSSGEWAVAVDSLGDAYVAGGGGQAFEAHVTPGAYQDQVRGNQDGTVMKIRADATGSQVLYGTFLGGLNNLDPVHGIAVDAAGNVYVAGQTESTDFPNPGHDPQNSYDLTYNGGATDGYVAVFDPTLSTLLFFTYLGGAGDDLLKSIAVDSAQKAYVAGVTDSTDLPFKSAFQSSLAGNDDFYVSKLDPGVSGEPSLVYLTYLGGQYLEAFNFGNQNTDSGKVISVDAGGHAHISGVSGSADYPTMLQLQDYAGNDIVVTKLSPTGSSLVYSTFLGGGGDEAGHALTLDSLGVVYVTGRTSSTTFPLAGNPFQDQNAGDSDLFVSLIEPTLPCASTVLTVEGLQAEVQNLTNPDPEVQQALLGILDDVEAYLGAARNALARRLLVAGVPNGRQRGFMEVAVISANRSLILLDESNSLVCGAANLIGAIPLPESLSTAARE